MRNERRKRERSNATYRHEENRVNEQGESPSYVDMLIYAQTNSAVMGQYMWMMLRNGKIYGAFFGNDVSGPTVFQANKWYHMAFTYDLASSTQTVYVNGVVGRHLSNADRFYLCPFRFRWRSY